MIIILKKDGQVVTDEANPVDIHAMDDAAMILADPQNGNTIVYNASAGMWVAGEGGGGFSPDITDPQDGDTLVYDGTAGKWVNGAGSSGGGVLYVSDINDGDEFFLDKNYNEIYSAVTSGLFVILKIEQSGNVYLNQLKTIHHLNDEYTVTFAGVAGYDVIYMSDSATGRLIADD